METSTHESSSPAAAGWSARPSFGGSRRAGATRLLTATREQLDLRDQAAVNYWFRANRPEYVFLVAGTVGGIFANSTRPGRVHLRQHDDPRDGGARRASVRREEAALPRQLVHLPAAGAAADEGGAAAHRPARADQRAVRDREDRRHQVVRGVSPQYGCELHFRDADEPLRPERQLRPDAVARAAGADPQVPRREGRRDAARSRSGAPAIRAASFCTSTISPTRASS